MLKAYALAGLVAMLPGCAAPAKAWKGKVEWPDDYSGKNIVPFMEARAALAAAAAVREMVRTNPFPNLFWGCATPEQGLDVAVYTGPTPGLYYVKVIQRFDRCGGPYVRVLDGWYLYAVTPQGEVVAEAPYPPEEDTSASPLPSSPPPPPEQTPPPAAPPPSPGADTPAPTPPSAPAPAAPPPAEPSPTSPPPVPPASGPASPTPPCPSTSASTG